jgi:hypothetical protein
LGGSTVKKVGCFGKEASKFRVSKLFALQALDIARFAEIKFGKSLKGLKNNRVISMQQMTRLGH